MILHEETQNNITSVCETEISISDDTFCIYKNNLFQKCNTYLDTLTCEKVSSPIFKQFKNFFRITNFVCQTFI